MSRPTPGGVSRPTPGGGGCPGSGPGGCILACTEADTPQQMATDASGIYPTGMHSCFENVLYYIKLGSQTKHGCLNCCLGDGYRNEI